MDADKCTHTQEVEKHPLTVCLLDEGGTMSRPSSCSVTPPFYRVSERDLTDVELHSVDSISDLHRTHTQMEHKGSRGMLALPHGTPSSNGSPYVPGGAAVNHRGEPPPVVRRQGRLQDTMVSRWGRCGTLSLLLLLVLLVVVLVCCLVQQGDAMRSLAEAVREKQAVSMEMSQLLQELQVLRHNLTAVSGGL